MLKSISIFTGILILGIGEIIFAKIVLNENIKVSKLKVILALLLVALSCTIANISFNGVVKTMIVLIVHIFEFKFLFKLEYQRAIILAILYIISLILPEMVEIFTATVILNINTVYFYNNIAGGIISNIIICILFIIQTFFIRKFLNRIINYELGNSAKIIILAVLTLICTLIIFYNAFSNITLNSELIISIFTMVIFVCILLSLIKQTVINNSLTKKYEQVLEFMTTYEDEIEKQRVLRHETKNAFLTIKAQITDKTKEKEIIEYIDSILQDDIKMKNEEYAKFKYLPANGIKGLCYYKMQEAQDKKIKVSINISSRIKNSALSKLSIKERKELGKILGVFLDNAIEASANSKDKVIGFEIYLIDNQVKIIISNSYENKIDINKIGQERYSTKGKNRGHGLLLVKSIVNDNNIFETHTEVTDKLYIQTIMIKESTEEK